MNNNKNTKCEHYQKNGTFTKTKLDFTCFLAQDPDFTRPPAAAARRPTGESRG